MNGKRMLNAIILGGGYYLWVVLVFAIATFFFDARVAAFELLIFFILLVIYIVDYIKKNNEIINYVESLALGVNAATKDTLVNFSLPVVVLKLDGAIAWYNDLFSNMLGSADIFERNITEFVPELDLNGFRKDDLKVSSDILHNGRYYHIFGNIAKINENDDSYLIVLYWDDRTYYETIKKKYFEEKFVTAAILIDNYDDVTQDIPTNDRHKLNAAIDNCLDNMTQTVNGILKKYEKDRYFLYITKKNLDKFINEKFEILDKIREIDVGNKISPTLSIGIGTDGESLYENDVYAMKALDMALGRGGDQVVVKNSDQFTFYGGKSKETEKRTRVRARVVAYAVRDLLADSDSIFIMGHKNADADVIGSALGLYKSVKAFNENVYIVLENYNSTVAKIISSLGEAYDDVFISSAGATELATSSSLVFVVDTHKQSLVECPNLLEISKKVVIIDHHRRSTDFIENAVITYHEPYSSSASELVTEIIQYMNDKSVLTSKEAQALYAGICLDTKNFTFKTGVRTFEAASFLKRIGVDTSSVKKLFQVDQSIFDERLKIIDNAQIYKDKIAISLCLKTSDEMQTIVAQAADELLNITGVSSSFVVCDMGGHIIISARSYGDINVQVILEKLGGGGHLTIAGAQLYDVSIETAHENLLAAIDEYLQSV